MNALYICAECDWSGSDRDYFTEDDGETYCSLHAVANLCGACGQYDRSTSHACDLAPFISYEMVCPDCDSLATHITTLAPIIACSCGGQFTLISRKEAEL